MRAWQANRGDAQRVYSGGEDAITPYTQETGMKKRSIWPLVVATFLAGACTTVQNPVTGKQERTVMDEQTELAEGRKAHEAVLQEYPRYKDEQLQAYVNGVGQKLAKQSHRAALQWTFTVVDSPEVNAFALPGGYVYITRGIMAYLDSEADLAGVLGHEIGHVTARHGAQRATRQQQAGLGVLAATVLGAVLEARGVAGAADMAGQVGQVAAARYVAKYSQSQELQSDQLGAEYLSRSGYNPLNMVDVIQVLKDQEKFREDIARAEGRQLGERNDWLASHPTSDRRLQDIQQLAAQYKGTYSEDGRTRYLQAINGMPFGESREQGVTRGRNFYHEPLGIALTAPQGWKVVNAADSITVINGAGDAGLVVNLMPPKAGSTHEEIIRNVIKPDTGRVERRTLGGGLAATYFAGTRRNQQGQQVAVEATVATGPNNQNYLLIYGARDAAALNRARAGLREAEAAFRPLSEADRAAARPYTLRTVAYRGGGFAPLARTSPLTEYPEQQIKLLNGGYSAGEPKPGQWVKVVDVR
jgi:predicted Zn-dependent protease